VLVLAVLGMLIAGAAADSPPATASLRIPGTTLRLGMSDTLAATHGFPPGQGDVRRGSCRFFGLTSEAALTFADGRLTRAAFTVTNASPYETAYVQDQLAAMGYRRRCATLSPGKSDCDWTGPVIVHLQISVERLAATVERPAADTASTPPAASVPRTASPAPAPPAAAQEVPFLPDTLAVPIAGRPSHYAAAAVRHESRCGYPEAATKAGIQGRVWVIANVEVNGSVLEAHVWRGIPELNAAALACVKSWLLEPRTWQSRPCRYRVLIPIAFTLH
jgi:TonB family protein